MVEPSKIIFLNKKRYPKRSIESYSIMGTRISPNKILLHWACASLHSESCTTHTFTKDIGLVVVEQGIPAGERQKQQQSEE